MTVTSNWNILQSFSKYCFVLMIYCRTHNVSVCLYIAYIARGFASLYIKTLYSFITVLALSAAATVANIKIRYDAKTPQFAIYGTRVICVFYSMQMSQTHFRAFSESMSYLLVNCKIHI